MAGRSAPVYDELIRQAAQGEVPHNDDTTVKILELLGKRAARQRLAVATADPADPRPAQRRGLFTSGSVATNGGH